MNILFKGNLHFPHHVLLNEISYLAYSRLTPSEIEKARQAIQDFYENRGYLLVDVRAIMSGDTPDSSIVVFVIEEGQQYIIGNIRLSGLKYNREKFVRQFLRIARGEVLSRFSIIQTEKNFIHSALFEDVDIAVGKLHPQTNVVDLSVTLQERLPYFLSTGIGLDTEDGIKIFTEWGRRHLFGKGQLVKIGITGSYFYLKKVFFKHGFIHLDYLNPFLFTPRLQWQNRLEFETDKPTYVSFWFRKIGLISRLRYDFSSRLQAGSTLELERAWIFGPFDVEEMRKGPLNIQRNRRVTLDVIFNSVYPLLNPYRGMNIQIAYTLSGGVLGGNNNFHRIHLQKSVFLPLRFGTILALHNEIGWMKSFGKQLVIPDYLKFFLGGSGSVRGYRTNRIGPQDAQGRFVGGLAMQFFNLEFRKQLSAVFQGVFFIDGGALKNTFSQFKLGDYKMSVGLGLRWLVGGSVLRLDLGIKLLPGLETLPGWVHTGFGQHF